jgi:AraC-like DNA-binding protein
LRSRRLAERSIIVVAPPDVSHRIEKTVGDFDVIAFRSLDELDRWRRGETPRPETIRLDLVAALAEIGVDPLRLSSKLRHTLEAFAHHRTVPAAHQLAERWPSRRSFYRVWRDEIDEPPGSFLRRVRVLYAARLMKDGATTKEAALQAGFGSTDGLRRLLARHRKSGHKNE